MQHDTRAGVHTPPIIEELRASRKRVVAHLARCLALDVEEAQLPSTGPGPRLHALLHRTQLAGCDSANAAVDRLEALKCIC